MTLYPSNLISCSQPGPAGGLSASAGWQGWMKPGGLERDRIGRETRQSIVDRHLTGCGSDCESRRGEETPPGVWAPAGWRRAHRFDAGELSLQKSKKWFLTERLSFPFA